MVSSARENPATVANRVRQHIIRTVHHAKGGHIGGPLSAADMLTALYFHIMRLDPERPTWPDRDRFVFSKGHSAIGLYAVLAERGYFPLDELATFDQINSRLQGHPDMTLTPGIDMSTGSLGQGLSAGVGMAFGAKLRGSDFHVYVMLGDGECQEGQVWEAAMFAARYELSNLTAIIDCNGLTQWGEERERHEPVPDLEAKWRAFGWTVKHVDGHHIPAFIEVCQQPQEEPKPRVILAHTTKGKGISFMQNNYDWHSRVPTDEELQAALAELNDAGELSS